MEKFKQKGEKLQPITLMKEKIKKIIVDIKWNILRPKL